MTQTAEAARYERLQGYLASDPENLQLLADAADAALQAGRTADAVELVDRYAVITPPTPSLINLLGLVALADSRYDDAARIFETLLQTAHADPGLRFNLAWAKARMGAHEAALALLEDAVPTPQAAALRIRALHHLQRLDEALAMGEAWEGRSEDPDLWSALASVALDAEDLDRAGRWAPRGAATSEGQAALGMVAMAEGRDAEARALFERAVLLRPDSARGLLGLGAVLLRDNHPTEAAKRFDGAAEVFGNHLGSWIAAGWAWLLAGDATAARARFERVIELDDAFSEAHGGLALIDLCEGDVEAARRRAKIALRLDRQSLGGVLVESLLLQRDGDLEQGRRVLEIAMSAPMGPRGETLSQLIARQAVLGGVEN